MGSVDNCELWRNSSDWISQLQRNVRNCKPITFNSNYERPRDKYYLPAGHACEYESCGLHEGHTFIFSSSISDKDMETREARQRASKGRGKGKGKAKNKNKGDVNIGREYHGVGAIIDPKTLLAVEEFVQISSRNMQIKLRTHSNPLNIINTYAPQNARPIGETQKYYKELEGIAILLF